MKIAIVGCGALGSFYGAKLAREGQEVHFLLRYDYETVRRQGVSIRSPDGDFNARPRCGNTPEIIGVADLVLIGLKTTANDQFARLLPPLVGPRTAILTLQNGLGNEERLAALFPAEQILGGLCFVCLNRVAPGVIQHIGHGAIVLGEFRRWPEPRTHDIAALFRHAGVPCAVTDNLARAHWEKLTWNIPFNGLGVASCAGYEAVMSGRLPAREPATFNVQHRTSNVQRSIPEARAGRLDVGCSMLNVECPDPAPGVNQRANLDRCLTTGELLRDPRWAELVRALMREVIQAARALGHNLPDSLADKQIERTIPMGDYKASTLIDFERGQPLELESLFLEPLRQAARAGVATPRLAALCEVLRRL
jgi:2-dehydropantoate 2-reductase